ncbi:MAG: hypothetical protein AAF264_08610, partial [Pseudomonadota bacterium]
FATQSLADIDRSALAPALIESCPTRVFLPNDRALEPQIAAIYARFGLNARQIDILAQATPKRDYYCQSRRGNRLFELGLSEIALAFCAASSKTYQADIARIVRAHRTDGFAAAWLRHRGLAWAAELLAAEMGQGAPKGERPAEPSTHAVPLTAQSAASSDVGPTTGPSDLAAVAPDSFSEAVPAADNPQPDLSKETDDAHPTHS